MRQLGQVEQVGHDNQHIGTSREIKQQTSQSLSPHPDCRFPVGEQAPIAVGAGQQSCAQQQGLLDDEYQYGRNKETGEACLRIEGRDTFVFHRKACHLLLPDGQADAPADELWRMIVEKLPKGRASTRTR